jgi:pyridoxal 5'-phosphate synthase pdxT subunit
MGVWEYRSTGEPNPPYSYTPIAPYSHTMPERPTVGVLSLQGDVEKHLQALERAGVAGRPVKTAEGLAEVDGLIIPGGESTTVGMLLDRFGLSEPIRERARAGMPVFGTCTGLILLARDIRGSDQPRIGLMDIEVERNAYGRQVDSFETDIPVPELGEEPVHAVFIRAPAIRRVGPEVEVLAEVDETPLLVRQDRILGASFHPELTDDARLHALFGRLASEFADEQER